MARQPQHAYARTSDDRRRRGRGYDYRVVLMGLESSVPIKPATWAMMLLGFTGLGLAFRQSRRRASMALNTQCHRFNRTRFFSRVASERWELNPSSGVVAKVAATRVSPVKRHRPALRVAIGLVLKKPSAGLG